MPVVLIFLPIAFSQQTVKKYFPVLAFFIVMVFGFPVIGR
jgi:hypothetical protein